VKQVSYIALFIGSLKIITYFIIKASAGAVVLPEEERVLICGGLAVTPGKLSLVCMAIFNPNFAPSA